MCAVLYYGIRKAYRYNQNIDNKSFIERYAVLSVPVFIKFICIALPIQALTMIILHLLSNHYVRMHVFSSCFQQLYTPLFYILFFHLIAKSFKRFAVCIKEKRAISTDFQRSE